MKNPSNDYKSLLVRKQSCSEFGKKHLSVHSLLTLTPSRTLGPAAFFRHFKDRNRETVTNQADMRACQRETETVGIGIKSLTTLIKKRKEGGRKTLLYQPSL